MLVKVGETMLLVDAGISLGAMNRGLSRVGAKAGELSAVIVTHEHGDHVRGLPALCKAHPHVPVFATRGTARALGRATGGAVSRPYLNAGLATGFGPATLTPIEVAHDAAEPIGLRIDCGDLSLGIATDLGMATLHVQEMLCGCRGLVIEANHDRELLRNGPYPGFLKRRIASPLGHLSNDETARLLREVAGPHLEYVVLAHLSRTNNSPDLALAATIAGTPSLEGTEIRAACQDGSDEPRGFAVELNGPPPSPSRATPSERPASPEAPAQPRLFD